MTTATQASAPAPSAQVSDDPFELDIAFVENIPASELVLMCTTGDNCGSSCPSACGGSSVE